MTDHLPAIKAVLGAYRSTAAHIDKETITSAWTEYEEAREAREELMSLGAERELTAELEQVQAERNRAVGLLQRWIWWLDREPWERDNDERVYPIERDTRRHLAAHNAALPPPPEQQAPP